MHFESLSARAISSCRRVWFWRLEHVGKRACALEDICRCRRGQVPLSTAPFPFVPAPRFISGRAGIGPRDDCVGVGAFDPFRAPFPTCAPDSPLPKLVSFVGGRAWPVRSSRREGRRPSFPLGIWVPAHIVCNPLSKYVPGTGRLVARLLFGTASAKRRRAWGGGREVRSFLGNLSDTLGLGHLVFGCLQGLHCLYLAPPPHGAAPGCCGRTLRAPSGPCPASLRCRAPLIAAAGGTAAARYVRRRWLGII